MFLLISLSKPLTLILVFIMFLNYFKIIKFLVSVTSLSFSQSQWQMTWRMLKEEKVRVNDVKSKKNLQELSPNVCFFKSWNWVPFWIRYKVTYLAALQRYQFYCIRPSSTSSISHCYSSGLVIELHGELLA